MAGETTGRPLLPHAPQATTFSFVQPTVARQENGQKSYVFVDEHNRHKRLKVMRACQGCRGRKIKCDAATTNIWPCSSCTRLKLRCIPPAVDGDNETANPTQTFEQVVFEAEPILDYAQNARASPQGNGTGNGNPLQPQFIPNGYATHDFTTDNYIATTTYPEPSFLQATAFNHQTTPDPLATSYQTSELSFNHSLGALQTPPTQAASDTADSWHSGGSNNDLSDALGELKIDESGVAPYLSQHRRHMAEIPPQGEIDDLHSNIPISIVGPDLRIRIPPEYMPSEELALHYFDIFFNNIHPYVPVLDKHKFYEDWYTNREAISPLVLEAIFACAGRLSDDPSQGSKWLALAERQSDSFMDVARLSTIQAQLILLKARESAPKRGYYFRSWMAIKNIVTLAIELGLNEHMDDHREGKHCGSSPPDCLVKTRVWQACFVCELMIGAPQGRIDMSVDPDTVDASPPQPALGIDASDIALSRNFTHFTGVIRNVRHMNDVWGRVKKKKDWGVDPSFVRLGPAFREWHNELPRDLWVSYPADGSPPKLQSHFVGNLHSYYHLSLIMLHRPQLAFTDPGDAEWRRHMLICYNSAKKLCQLQEAILQGFQLRGLLCMQRGINFTIYTILTCTCLHLVALTSPDPEFNNDAKDYFERHMRILEQCTSSWPMPEMQAQIDALREAFSADTSRPFELKSSFPRAQTPVYTSSSDYMNALTPPSLDSNSLTFNTQSISPGSNGPYSSQTSPAAMQNISMPQSHHEQQMVDIAGWNPSRIFDQWNTAFGPPPPTQSASPPLQPQPMTSTAQVPMPSTTYSPPLATVHRSHQHSPTPPLSAGADHLHQQHQSQQAQSYMTAGSQFQHQQQQQPVVTNPTIVSAPTSSPVPGPTFVSPMMWQESVASVFDGGIKRRWEDCGGAGIVEGLVNNKRVR